MKPKSDCLFDYKTVEALDLPLLFKHFSNYFHFNSNKQQLENFNTIQQKNDIELFYEAQNLFFQFTSGEEQDLKTLIKSCDQDFNFEEIKTQVSKKYLLEDEDLYKLTSVMILSRQVQKNYKDIFIQLLAFGEVDVGITTKEEAKFDKLITEISKIIDSELREIDFTRHPNLSPIYKKISQIEKNLRKEILSISKEWSNNEIISQESHDIVDNHFVIPVRSERFQNGLGQIIYRSKSGQTLYLEPYQLQELVNEKRNLEADYTREKNKVCHRFAHIFYETLNTINYRLKSILVLDKLNAHQAINRDFHLIHPTFEANTLYFEKMYHPLIKNAVANDLKLEDDHSGLLISGPNTGGKTVLLKTIALNLILPHFGFFVSAQRASIPLTPHIHFISNDQQDLEEGLSSFSSEAENYLKVLEKIESGHFIFIDEIFNSTTSSEASIISDSLINEFLSRSAKVFISSHHEQLKERVFKSNILTSAHMGFAKNDKGPTYKLHVGTPGHSHALDIFEKIESKILGKSLLSKSFIQYKSNEKEQDLSAQIKKLSLLEMELHEAEQINLRLKQSLEFEKKAIKGSLNLKRAELENEYLKKWNKAKEEIFNVGEEIKKQGLSNKHKIAIKINRIAPQVEKKKITKEVIKREPIDLIMPNMLVFSSTFNEHGKVIKANKQQAFVQFKKVKSWVNIEDLYKSQKKSTPLKNSGYIEKSSSTSTLFDARGMRREPFLNDVEIKVYDLVNGDIPYLDIIHGHGEGILKSSLLKYLKKVEGISYGFIEGNQGTTRVTLKNK